MALSLSTMHKMIVKEVASKRSIRESMDRIIAKCEMGHPHRDWKKLRSIKYENLDELRGWIETPFRVDPPKSKLTGFWFGLCNPYDDEPLADIYVCGSKRFNPDPNSNAWAVGPTWCPDGAHAQSTVLATIYRIAYRDGGLENDAEYPLCLAYGSLAVRDILDSTDPALFLGKSKSIGVAVGFDSGDFVLVGELSRLGLSPI